MLAHVARGRIQLYAYIEKRALPVGRELKPGAVTLQVLPGTPG